MIIPTETLEPDAQSPDTQERSHGAELEEDGADVGYGESQVFHAQQPQILL
jgi:hypothetical protein